MRDDNILVGKTIASLDISANRQSLRFVIADGDVVTVVEAECCSYSWIEHVDLPALGFPAKVVSVSNIPMPDGAASNFHATGDDEYSGVIQFYGCKVVTDRGDMVIEYRNDSNGYYGGALLWPGDQLYDYVSNKIVTRERL